MSDATEIRQYATAREYEEATTEYGLKPKGPAVHSEAVQDDVETRTAGSIRWGDAILGVVLAILPLYFVGFAIAAYVRNGTPASSFRNVGIFQMSKLNPTVFPILFTLIFARFIKSLANWKLERGATVGHIQHLLGSRSMVSSIFTPIKLRTTSFLVPLLIMLWLMNPLGGQLSLRVAKKEVKVTTIDASFVYLSPTLTYDQRAAFAAEDPDHPEYYIGRDRVVENVFATSLFSPNESKNAAQDMFGNVKIPLLEHLLLSEASDSDGWIYTARPWKSAFQDIAEAALDMIGLPISYTKPIYSSIIGLPHKANMTVFSNNTGQIETSHDAGAQALKDALFGSDAIKTKSQFAIETSYMYANCTTKPTRKGQIVYPGEWDSTRSANLFPNGTRGVATNRNGFSIAYDPSHSSNSTAARIINLRSWLALPLDPQDNFTLTQVVSDASCTITQTYVEASVLCASQGNCTVARIRESKKVRIPRSPITALDGITIPIDLMGPSIIQEEVDGHNRRTKELIPSTFFKNFVNATSFPSLNPSNLSPLESYFATPEAPFKASARASGESDNTANQYPITDVGDQIFSWRLSQLMNTYWLASSEPFTVINGVDLEAVQDADAMPLPVTQGKLFIERDVLRCHRLYFTILMVISLGLFALGMVTAYLDAVRRGPDVLDDFVTSLRHNPYVHIDSLGPSMQDGQEISRRLRSTVVQMGDVRPNDSVGYVAIGTPNDRQPIEKLDPRRHYL